VLLYCPQGDGNPGSTYRVTLGQWADEPGGTQEYRDDQGRYLGQDDHDGFTGWMSWDGGFQRRHDDAHPLAPPAPAASK
jgi:hypothetical protein